MLAMMAYCGVCGNFDILNSLGQCTVCAIIIEEWDLDPKLYDHSELA